MDYTAANLITYFSGLDRTGFNNDSAEVQNYGLASYFSSRWALTSDQITSLTNTNQLRASLAKALSVCGHDFSADGFTSVSYDFSGMTVTNNSTDGHVVIHINIKVIWPAVTVSFWIEHKNS